MQPLRENLLTRDQPPQSPQGWEHWFLQVTRKAIKADYLANHARQTARTRPNTPHTRHLPPEAKPPPRRQENTVMQQNN